MILSSQLKPGIILNLEGQFHKVIQSTLHSGTARMGTMVHAKLRNLNTGTILERRFGSDEKLTDVLAERTRMQFLYKENNQYVFMNPGTYDQVPIPQQTIGPAANYLKENDLIEVEFHEGKAISLNYPEIVEIRVASTGTGIRGQSDSTYKEATLENGLTLLVPQFIEIGNAVRIQVETGTYVERVQEKSKERSKK